LRSRAATSPMLSNPGFVHRCDSLPRHRTVSRIPGQSVPMKATTEQNKGTRLGGVSTRLFNKRDLRCSREVLGRRTTCSTVLTSSPAAKGSFNLVKTLPPTLKYEHGTIVADGDFVIVHGRFSGVSAGELDRGRTLFASRMAPGRALGCDSRTRRLRKRPRAKRRCFGTSFPIYPRPPHEQRTEAIACGAAGSARTSVRDGPP